jgi:hypothetical protein
MYLSPGDQQRIRLLGMRAPVALAIRPPLARGGNRLAVLLDGSDQRVEFRLVLGLRALGLPEDQGQIDFSMPPVSQEQL